MEKILELILSNPHNTKVLKFLEITDKSINRPTSYNIDSVGYDDAEEKMLRIDVPIDAKFRLNSYIIIIIPASGEIIAFNFGRFEFTFRFRHYFLYLQNCRHIKNGL